MLVLPQDRVFAIRRICSKICEISTRNGWNNNYHTCIYPNTYLKKLEFCGNVNAMCTALHGLLTLQCFSMFWWQLVLQVWHYTHIMSSQEFHTHSLLPMQKISPWKNITLVHNGFINPQLYVYFKRFFNGKIKAYMYLYSLLMYHCKIYNWHNFTHFFT